MFMRQKTDNDALIKANDKQKRLGKGNGIPDLSHKRHDVTLNVLICLPVPSFWSTHYVYHSCLTSTRSVSSICINWSVWWPVFDMHQLVCLMTSLQYASTRLFDDQSSICIKSSGLWPVIVDKWPWTECWIKENIYCSELYTGITTQCYYTIQCYRTTQCYHTT